MVGDSGRSEAAVDLLEGDGRPTQGVAGLRVDLSDSKLLLRAVLHGNEAHAGGLHGNVDGVDHGVASGRLSLHKGIFHGGLQLRPTDDALAVGGSGAGGAIRAVQGKGGSSKYLTAAAHLGDLQRAHLRLLTAPFEDSVGSLCALGGDRK